jgi:uncharacterized protein (TIGR03000 family)
MPAQTGSAQVGRPVPPGTGTVNNPNSLPANTNPNTVTFPFFPFGYPWGTGFPFGYYGGGLGYWPYSNQMPNYAYPASTTPGTNNPYMNGMATPYGQSTATISIRVPYSAEVWVQDQKLEQSGEERKYVTPVLDTNRSQNYNIRAIWYEGDKKVEVNQPTPIRGGNPTRVMFFGNESESRQPER